MRHGVTGRAPAILPFFLPRGGCMTARRPYSRTGLNALKARLTLRGMSAIDRRSAPARATLAFRSELVAALGGEADLSPQKRRLTDMAARAALLLDHVDAWRCQRRSLVNARAKALLPVLAQRPALAAHPIPPPDQL